MNVRANIQRMTGYVPGEQPQVGKVIKLNTNENPYACSPKVKAAIGRVVTQGLQQYPDPTATAFRARVGELLDVDPESVLCGNGSDDLLTIITRTFVDPGDVVRFAYPGYVLYQTLAEIQGASYEAIPFNQDWSVGEAFAAKQERLRLAYLANPNSPSGTMVPPERVAELAAALPCPLVVDEAYVDFSDRHCLEVLKQCENVVITRTLSKSYALAGLRFGYLIARPELVRQLTKVKDSYNCDALSIAGATAAIDDQAWLAENQQTIRATRTRLAQALEELGFDVAPSQANFLWATRSDRPVQPIYEALKRDGVLVRFLDYPNWGDGLRITVGSDAQIDVLLELLTAAIAA